MDIFVEQLVERKPDSRNILIKFGLLALIAGFCTLFLIAAIFILGAVAAPIGIFAIPGVIWLGNQFIKGLTCEYEYILTNKDLDIDKITGKTRRKRMVTFDLNNAEALDIYTENLELDAQVTVSAHDNTYVNMWYLSIKHESHGNVVLLFNPNDAFLLKLNKSLPARARNNKITQKGETD
jgi:hypothetical protein